MTEKMVIQIIMAALGAFGYGMFLHVSGGRLVTIFFGGAANWGFYLLALHIYDDKVLSFFAAAFATAALAEILARLCKVPAITLLVPMMVPLVPGGDLYYTTLALVQGKMAEFADYGNLVLKEAGAMSLGIILVACSVQILQKLWTLRGEKKA